MLFLLFMLISTNTLLYSFSNTSTSDWKVVDDVIMDGRSSGNFSTNAEGKGVFYGAVSTENNGGFSSIRMTTSQQTLNKYNAFIIRLKGDGKSYQFRVKSNTYDAHSYIKIFQTSNKWQEVHISFDEMYPSFRGRKLNLANFDSQKQIAQIGFLIGNKTNENFKLEIDWIKLAS